MIKTNFDKTPEELILELFNAENDKHYSRNDVDILTGFKGLANKRRSVTAQILNRTIVDVDVPFATLKYTPIDLSVQFSVIALEIREVDTFDNLLSVTDTLILSEVHRRYGIRCDTWDFGIRRDGGNFYLYASPTNRAYSGEVLITLNSSLHTRVSNKVLVGFYPAQILTGLVVVPELDLYEPLDTYVSAKRLSWFKDFTRELDYMRVVDGKLYSTYELNARLAIYGVPPIEDGVNVVSRAVRTANDENTLFTHVLKVTGKDDRDAHYLHYNIIPEEEV